MRCHASESLVVPEAGRFITPDLRFSHARHERDPQGRPIACAACHDRVGEAVSIEQVPLPEMRSCAVCHGDPARTGDAASIARCDLCHRAIQSGVAPRDHLGRAVPDNHTIAFRRDHEDAARSDNARCPLCHGGLSGSSHDNCFECHAVMKPRDHTLRWAAADHGPEAAVDRERCAACHEADYCARCHSERPRSHVPFDSFVAGGHGVDARFNLRACLACHAWNDGCARCHQGAAFPDGRKGTP